MEYQLNICEVHQLLDNDSSLKECSWCNACSAWICKEDISRFDRRVLAASKRVVGRLRKPEPTSITPRTSGCGCGKK